MNLLDQAVETVQTWGANRKKDRTQCVRLFRQSAKHMDRGIAIGEEFLKKAPESGDCFTTVLWMGPTPAKKLQAIYLESKATAIALTELTGVRFKR